jgi:hypothetical protein
MSEVVTLELPDALVQSARVLAVRSNRRVEDVLVEWIDRAASEVPVDLLPDDQILLLCALEMTEADQTALSELLDRQREGTLTDTERSALDVLHGDIPPWSGAQGAGAQGRCGARATALIRHSLMLRRTIPAAIDRRVRAAAGHLVALQLADDPDAITVRSHWVLGGWHPPAE